MPYGFGRSRRPIFLINTTAMHTQNLRPIFAPACLLLRRCGVVARSIESNANRKCSAGTRRGGGRRSQRSIRGDADLLEPERSLTLLAVGRVCEFRSAWASMPRREFCRGGDLCARTWTCRAVGVPKSKASRPQSTTSLLDDSMLRWQRRTPYAQPRDWVFPSFRLKGKQPRVANTLVEIISGWRQRRRAFFSSHQNEEGELVEDDRVDSAS